MEQKTCPFKSECQLQQVGKLANTEIIRELVCDGEPRECKTYLRMWKEHEKGVDRGTQGNLLFGGGNLSAAITVR